MGQRGKGGWWRERLRAGWGALDGIVAAFAGGILAAALIGARARTSAAAEQPWIAAGLWLALALVLASWPRRRMTAVRVVLAGVWLGVGILEVVARVS